MRSHDFEVGAVVIGAGVVGLACAKALAEAGQEVVLLEALDAPGTVTSSRNSEVIHSGLYYARGSLKALLCVRGRDLLYDYCESRGLAHRRCGKLVVATSPAEVGELEALLQRALDNGVNDVRLLDGPEAKALEPALRAMAALECPSTGILDSHAFMMALLADAQAHGAQLVCRSTVVSARTCTHGGLELQVDGPESFALRAGIVVNAAGLQAPDVAGRILGLPVATVPRQAFCKGSYFSLAGRAPFSRLIYPVPEVGGLGVHLTLDLGGQARFGPDVQWLDAASADQLPYEVDVRRSEAFYDCIRNYWPGLKDGALLPAYSGVRPKLRRGDGTLIGDFLISGPEDHGCEGLVNLFGIESPGLTASLAIAEYVLGLL